MGLALCLLASAAAAPLPAAPDTTAQIVVTGERVKRSLKDTASSVAVVTRSQIEAASADRIEQVLELIPNVQLGSGGEGPTIRGQDTTGPTRDLPAFLGGTRPRTTLIIDGRPASYDEFIFGATPMWDVDQVEVFRTPQTTTQGRNSIAGAIFVTTGEPSFQPEARVRGIVSSAHTRELSALAGGPLVDGQVAWRVSGDYRKGHGSSRIADVVEGANPNIDEYSQTRVKLLATPDALPGTRIDLSYSHSQSKMPQIEGVRPPFRARRDPFDGYGTFHTSVDAVTAKLGYHEGSTLDASLVFTGDGNRVRRFAPPGLGQSRINIGNRSAEALVHWRAGDALHIVAGASRYATRLRQFIDLSQLAGIGSFRDRQASSGIFGEVDWTVAEHTVLTGGLRYQRDAQRRTGALATTADPIPLNYTRTFDALLPKLSVAHDFGQGVRVGALVQRAYNPGGTTLRFDTGAADNFDAETLWDYELFARASIHRALKLTANLFYYDQKNAQRARSISIPAPTGAIVTFADLFNVPKARSYGAEAGVSWNATRRLSAQASIGLLRTNIIDGGAAGAAYDGKEFQRSPHFSGTAAVDWRPTDALRLSAQLHHTSSYFSGDLETASGRIGGFTTLNARAEWTRGRSTVFAYARNALNDFHLTYLFGPELATAGDPRELGLGLELRL